MPVAAPPRPSRAAPPRAASQPRAAARPAHASRLHSGGRIRWDRVGRIALLVLLAIVLGLYASPLSQWLAQSRAADEQRQTLHALKREHARLDTRVRELGSEPALEREARRYGMVRRGERAFVIQPAPARER
jgi:cell division protein FtsB